MDTPYGLGLAQWDHASWESDLLRRVLQQIVAANCLNKFVLVMMINIRDVDRYWHVLENNGYSNVTPLYWCKEHVFKAGNTSQWASCVETLLVAEHGGPLHNSLSVAPAKRCNFLLEAEARWQGGEPDGKARVCDSAFSETISQPWRPRPCHLRWRRRGSPWLHPGRLERHRSGEGRRSMGVPLR